MKRTTIILILLFAGIWCMENREKVAAKYDRASGAVRRFLWGTKLDKPDGAAVADDPAEMRETGKDETEPPKLELPPPAILSITQELASDLYFTKERLTMMSDDGIRAIGECVMVRKIGEQDGKYIVKDEKVQLAVDPWKLTRDKDEINALKKRAAALQETQRPPVVATANKTKSSKDNASDRKKNSSPIISSERAQIEVQISVIDREIASLSEAVAYKQLAEYEARRRGRSSSHGAEASRLRLKIMELEKTRAYYYSKLQQPR